MNYFEEYRKPIYVLNAAIVQVYLIC